MKKQYESPEVTLERFQAEEMLMTSAGDGGVIGPPEIDRSLTNGTLELKFGD